MFLLSAKVRKKKFRAMLCITSYFHHFISLGFVAKDAILLHKFLIFTSKQETSHEIHLGSDTQRWGENAEGNPKLAALGT